MLRRLLFVFRMVVRSFFLWGPKSWSQFWFGKKTDVFFGGFKLNTRSTNYKAKIADLAMAWEVFNDSVYDAFEIKKDDVVVDIGAHIGSFTIKAAGKCKRVVSFEPFSETFEVLKSNAGDLSNVSINNVGIAGESKETEMYLSEDNPAENSITRKVGRSVVVRLLSLKEAFSLNDLTQVDLLKVDCEGAEFEILMNAGSELNKINKIVMEVHEPVLFGLDSGYTIKSLCDFLEKNGFYVEFKRENNFQGYIYASRSVG